MIADYGTIIEEHVMKYIFYLWTIHVKNVWWVYKMMPYDTSFS